MKSCCKESLYHYLDPDDYNRLFYYQKSEDSKETEKKLCNKSGLLLHTGKDLLSDQKEYLDLKRALEEQTVKENGTRRFKTGQDEKMNSTVLQNPSDPDATYREKAGSRYIGYAANFEESVGENGSVITDFDFEPNTCSDKKFIQDNISRKERSTEKSTMIVDGGYSSVEVINKAKEKNIDIIATNLTGRDTPEVYADFELSEDGKRVIHCVNGCTPKKSSYNAKAQRCTAPFLKEQCVNCPFRDQCHPKFYKKAARVWVSSKSVMRAKYRKAMRSEEYKDYARLRNGIKTISSVLRRNYNVDHLPRGWQRDKFTLGCKIMCLNFRKLFNFRSGRGNYAQNPVITANLLRKSQWRTSVF